jgi:hypothetical protein
LLRIKKRYEIRDLVITEESLEMKGLSILLMALLLIGMVAVSCRDGDEGVPTPPSSPSLVLPVIHHFDAVPTSIATGKYSTLDWSVSGAQQVEISPGLGVVGAVDSIAVSPAATTNYTLIASNGSGSVTATVQVEVAKPPAVLPVIHYFTVSPSSIPPGGVVLLSWEVSGADQITLSDVVVVTQNGFTYGRGPVEQPAVGNRGDQPGIVLTLSPGDTYTYTLTATSSAGTATKTVTISITP